MSRRAQRRKSKTSSSRNTRGGSGRLYRILAVLVLMVIAVGVGGYFWLRSYLHSDDFRIFLGQKVGEAIQAEAHFELFEWQGMEAKTGGFSAENGKLIKAMRADGVQAEVNLSGVKRGVWEISDLRIKQLDVRMDVRENQESDRESDLSSEGGNGGFLDSLLPKQAELSSAEIDWLNINLQAENGHFQASNIIARIDSGGADGSYDVNLADGLIETSWFGSSLKLNSARGRYQKGRIFITDSNSRVYERGVLNMSGEIGRDEFGLYGGLKGVEVGELVPEDWQKRISGDLLTEFNLNSGLDLGDGKKRSVKIRGELELKRGVLTALPVLDTIAAYANTRRFRRLDFSEAKLKYEKQGGRLELTDIVLATEGLVRVEGNLTLEENGEIDGRFKVGITPGTLAHIPGAETKVFIRGEKGLLWSPLRITGNMNDLKEDLTDRMITAAGERMFELIPETGVMALKFAHDSAVQLPEQAAETGVKAIETGTNVLEKGLEGDVIGGVEEGVRGLFDLIPSAPKRTEEETEEKE